MPSIVATPDIDRGRVALEVVGGDPETALYIFRRSTTGGGVDIVRDTSEGSAGFPALAESRRNLLTNPKPAGSTAGWVASSGTLALVNGGGGGMTLSVAGDTTAAASVRAVGPEGAGQGWPTEVGRRWRATAELENVFTGPAVVTTSIVGLDAAGAVVETIATDVWNAAAGATRAVDIEGTVANVATTHVRSSVAVTLTGVRNLVAAGSFEDTAELAMLRASATLDLEQSADWSSVGTYSLAARVVTAATTNAVLQDLAGPVTVGRYVAMAADIRLAAGTVWVRPGLVFRNASNGIVGGVQFGAYTQATGTAVRVSHSAVVPATAVRVESYVYMYGSNAGANAAANAAILVDGWTAVGEYTTAAAALADVATWRPILRGKAVEVNRAALYTGPDSAAVAGAWFDGDTVSADPAYGYAWEGEADASASIYGAFVPATFYDYEAMQGDTVDYILANEDGQQLDAVRVSIPLWGTWLKSPGRPSRNLRVHYGKLENRSLPIAREVYDVEGSGQVVVYSAQRSSARGARLELVTRSAADVARMELLLSDGVTLLLDTNPAWGVRLRYLSVGDVEESRPLSAADGFQNLAAEARLWGLADVVEQPSPQGVTAEDTGRTYAAIPSEFSSYVAIPATVATYEALATQGVS